MYKRQELDAYWDNNPDRDVKGSGNKPYQRWKEYWKHYLNVDGTLMTSSQIAQQFVNSRKPIMPKTKLSLAKTTALDESDWKPLGPYSHTNKGSWSPGPVSYTHLDVYKRQVATLLTKMILFG